MVKRGELKGHNGWVTAIAVPASPSVQDMIISSSRDKSIIIWAITKGQDEEFGFPQRRLVGHNHYVQDVTCTADGKYVLSGSWDGTLRLWDLENDAKNVLFRGHTKDVLSVAFSDTNKHIVSGSRDKTIKVWNVIGRCAATLSAGKKAGHTEWVTCVRVSTSNQGTMPSYIVSASWDKTVKIWNLSTYQLVHTLTGHETFVNTICLAPDGSLCASGDRNGRAILSDLITGAQLSELEAGDSINSLAFSPARFWLCAATTTRIVIWDLETKLPIDEIANPTRDNGDGKKRSNAQPIQCLCIAWSNAGDILYAGYSNNTIVAYAVTTVSK